MALTKGVQKAISSIPTIPGPGRSFEDVPGIVGDEYKGMKVSKMTTEPLAFFHLNPENEVFRMAKQDDRLNPGYMEGLEKDIREAGTILDPLLTTEDGLIISGESRFLIGSKLAAEGLKQFGSLPVRKIMGECNQELITKRLILGNLSRFVVDSDTKVALYAKIWPGYFLAPLTRGRPPLLNPNDSDLIDQAAAHVTSSEIAAETGESQDTISNMKKDIHQTLEEHGEVTPQTVKKTREKKRQEKKSKAKAHKSEASPPIYKPVKNSESPVNVDSELREFKSDEGLNDVDYILKLLTTKIDELVEDTQKSLNGEDKTDMKNYYEGKIAGLQEALSLMKRIRAFDIPHE